ncbi:MAG TPA: prepilin-type N-terminal cleavage/methylation domain-containing protein [Candidatus Angelobacter sp.]|nr:prepilin-type N-terminal cleavage/methylation domain-containing protein [Candidatus Angelobacter sp.]
MKSTTAKRGFTLLELTLTLACIGVIAAIAVPPIMQTVNAFRLRSSAASLAALIQETRMLAVRDNKIYTMRSTAIGQVSLFYVDLDQNSTYRTGEEPVQLAQTVQIIPESQAPKPLPVTGGYAQDATDPVSFNLRGLPCQLSSPTVCSTLPNGNQIGFVYYLMGTTSIGPAYYKAVSVTPAGRVRIWSYSGGAWL